MRRPTTRERVVEFMEALGRLTSSEGRIYFTGGVSALLFGWRETTLDIDLKADPEPGGFFGSLGRIKDRLEINVELAAPSDFIPVLPGWQERSLFIARHAKIDFHHYDFYSQALAKIERFHARDQLDVAQMFERGLIQPGRLQELFDQIAPGLERYPGVHAAALAARVQILAAGQEPAA